MLPKQKIHNYAESQAVSEKEKVRLQQEPEEAEKEGYKEKQPEDRKVSAGANGTLAC